jgi:homeobox protein cut-like
MFLVSFSNQIDSLSRRCKATETVFLKVYKKLADAPDPSPLLLQAAEHQRRIDALQVIDYKNIIWTVYILLTCTWS